MTRARHVIGMLAGAHLFAFAMLYTFTACGLAAPAPPPAPAGDSAMIAVVTAPNTAALYVCALPPLPTIVPAAAGPIPVTRVASPYIEGIDTTKEQVLGAFDYQHRSIEIRRSLTGLAAWQTLAHERIHAALFDASVTLADQAIEDRIADAIANQQVNDMLLDAQLAGRCRPHPTH